MRSKGVLAIGLGLIAISQILMSFGYDFLMSQKPIDFAHWSLMVGALFMLSLWFNLPNNLFKSIGLALMTLGIAGIAGMSTLDFLLWASHGNPEMKRDLFEIISNTPSLKYPFLIVGPTLFYAGICISTYGLFRTFRWQVLLVNIGALMIGLGHMILNNQLIPVIGSFLLLVGLLSIIRLHSLKSE